MQNHADFVLCSKVSTNAVQVLDNMTEHVMSCIRKGKLISKLNFIRLIKTFGAIQEVPIAQWAKRRPLILAVPSSSPAHAEIFSTANGVPFHTAFHYQPLIVLIWLKYCSKGRTIASDPFGVIHEM